LNVEWQIEANSAATDISAPARDIRIALQSSIEALRCGFAGIDRRILRQTEIDQQLRTIRGRKELPGDERKREKGCCEECQRNENRQPFRSHGEGEEIPIPSKNPAGIAGRCDPRWLENEDAQQRCKDHRNEP